MTGLFPALERGSDHFVNQRYQEAIDTYAAVLERDPNNLMIHVRQAVAHSLLGREQEALDHFRTAERLDPHSVDLHHYMGMHYLRFGDDHQAARELEYVLVHLPEKLPALKALAGLRDKMDHADAALELFERALLRDPDDEAMHRVVARLAMTGGNTERAIQALERVRELAGNDFDLHLELGVCLLTLDRLSEAATHLDQVAPDHPGYPMALFKRAQISALLGEPDLAQRIQEARVNGNEITRQLIDRERLFQGYR
jgi:tetratricopeptide (TPR) repeat protein